MPDKIHIIDDDEALRDSLFFLLKSHGFDPVVYDSGEPFLDQDLSAIAAPVLLDIRMPGKHGMAVLSEALQRDGTLKFIMMSGHADIATAVKAVKLGAFNFLEKPFSDKQLLPIIFDAQTQLKSELTYRQEQQALSVSLNRLTPREAQVMSLLVDGKTNKIVARELKLSVRTVETHRAHLMSKLQAQSVSDLVKIKLALD